MINPSPTLPFEKKGRGLYVNTKRNNKERYIHQTKIGYYMIFRAIKMNKNGVNNNIR